MLGARPDCPGGAWRRQSRARRPVLRDRLFGGGGERRHTAWCDLHARPDREDGRWRGRARPCADRFEQAGDSAALPRRSAHTGARPIRPARRPAIMAHEDFSSLPLFAGLAEASTRALHPPTTVQAADSIAGRARLIRAGHNRQRQRRSRSCRLRRARSRATRAQGWCCARHATDESGKETRSLGWIPEPQTLSLAGCIDGGRKLASLIKHDPHVVWHARAHPETDKKGVRPWGRAYAVPTNRSMLEMGSRSHPRDRREDPATARDWCFAATFPTRPWQARSLCASKRK